MTRTIVLLVFVLSVPIAFGQGEPKRVEPAGKDLLATEIIPGKEVFVHNAIPKNKNARVTVWFEEQFLGDGKGYERRAKEFSKAKRTELRMAVTNTLKALSDRSYQKAKKKLDGLVKDRSISSIKRHWIVNGFSCTATPEGVKALQSVPGVRAIFAARGGFRLKNKKKGKIFDGVESSKFNPKQSKHPWYTRYLLADKVWNDFGVTGKGTLNIVHDFNFVFSDNVTVNLYRNPKEIPGNDKDDDGNGYIDDYHGYNFAQNSPVLTLQQVPLKGANPRAMHGFMCANIICGRGVKGKPYEFGLAPEGNWAGVIAGSYIEDSVEWAVEQGADTYSMSFSIPNLGEYRSHWRKVMEHGSFCGVYFASGAGNFAQQQPIPVQMRVPEDIPNAVFAATGVQRNLSRTPFSSKGPVEWNTHFYKDGRVKEPAVCAFNMGLPLQKLDGTVIGSAINGNSFAGPMCAGSLALMLSADPDLLPWDARAIITSTTTDVAKKGFDNETGHGLINCYRAVKEVMRRKAVREGKDGKKYEGRENGDELDVKSLGKKLQAVLQVARVQPNSQAAKLGLKAGDTIVKYNGKTITDQKSLMLAKKQADMAKLKEIPVLIERGDKRMEVTFEPGPLGIFPRFAFVEPVFE